MTNPSQDESPLEIYCPALRAAEKWRKMGKCDWRESRELARIISAEIKCLVDAGCSVARSKNNNLHWRIYSKLTDALRKFTTMPLWVRLSRSDIDHYNSLPPGEKLKAWESYSRLVQAGELEPFEGLIEKPESGE